MINNKQKDNTFETLLKSEYNFADFAIYPKKSGDNIVESLIVRSKSSLPVSFNLTTSQNILITPSPNFNGRYQLLPYGHARFIIISLLFFCLYFYKFFY